MSPLLITGTPSYSPLKLYVANAGSPFELDMNYTGRAPPSKFDWFKNGQYFRGDGERVTLSHTGIVFSRVLPGDAGQYLIRASTPNAGSTEATTTLKGMPFYTLTQYTVLSDTLFLIQWLFIAPMAAFRLVAVDYQVSKTMTRIKASSILNTELIFNLHAPN